MREFELETSILNREIDVYSFANASLVDPTNANPVIMGEFLELDANQKLIRGTVSPSTVPSWAYYNELGSYDVQASGKGAILMVDDYRAKTKIFDATALAIGDGLEVSNVSYNGVTKRGLKKLSSGYEVGRVLHIDSTNGILYFLKK